LRMEYKPYLKYNKRFLIASDTERVTRIYLVVKN
jgi:hypothetical protein